MFPRVAGPRRLAGITTLVFLTWITVLWIYLPVDSLLLSWVRLNTSKVSSVFRGPTDDERLLLERPGRFPFADDEVAYIVKTGYGTQERVPALLEASRNIGTGSKYSDDNILVVGDFATEFDFEGKTVVIHDMVAAAMEHEAVVKTPAKSTERMHKYGNMTLAIKDGRKKEAEQYSKAVGWELDALKVGWLAASPVPIRSLTDYAVHPQSRAGVEDYARQEMVHHAGRRHIYHTTIPIPISRAS